MTMIKKENWKEADDWYEVPVDESNVDEWTPEEAVARIAFWDRYTSVWITYCIDAARHQCDSAEYYANKRTFCY